MRAFRTIALAAIVLSGLAGGTACADPPDRTGASQPAKTAPAPQPRRFGHFPYPEAPRASLRAGVCSGAGERQYLRGDAADALAAMKAAAARDGVTLLPASCFRTVESQRRLFECIDAPNGTGCASGRLVSAERRATAVAPPGHSEHATGYAVDFFPSARDVAPGGGCATRAACTTKPAFAASLSGRWLAEHAPTFSFEQSFFPGSAQGVMVEAWHYRYVGSAEAAATFRAARAQFPPTRRAASAAPGATLPR